MSREPETNKKRTSGTKASGTKTSGKKASSKKTKKRKKAKMITFAIEAAILIVLLIVLYVLNRTELLSKVTYDEEVVQESVNELTKEKEHLTEVLNEKMDRWMYLEDLAERIKNEK